LEAIEVLGDGMRKISLNEISRKIDTPWSPVDVAVFNDSVIRMSKLEGEFVWHKHTNSDEVFLVFEGEFILQTKEENFDLKKMEGIVVPKGVLHCPKTDSSATVLVFELKGTKKYGD